ncbi:hypothetical protein OXYTRIMIC_052 [Oxytricha trifallax]|uniref:Uncharacterized protein n=1 Tax=Oxytricha trifallax TaxID=1172189 RepID=A0A073HZS5_9SPIT|nr:hypothetical protein OXYTRIMIC_052 [Oxytricha trifallax]
MKKLKSSIEVQGLRFQLKYLNLFESLLLIKKQIKQKYERGQERWSALSNLSNKHSTFELQIQEFELKLLCSTSGKALHQEEGEESSYCQLPINDRICLNADQALLIDIQGA